MCGYDICICIYKLVDDIKKNINVLYLPYTTRYASRVVNANELVAGGSDVKV